MHDIDLSFEAVKLIKLYYRGSELKIHICKRFSVHGPSNDIILYN